MKEAYVAEQTFEGVPFTQQSLEKGDTKIVPLRIVFLNIWIFPDLTLMIASSQIVI